MGFKTSLIQLLLAASLSQAHPHGHEAGVEERTTLPQPLYRRSLSHCGEHFSNPEVIKRDIERRIAEVKRLRKERSLEESPAILQGRDITKVLNTDHRVMSAFNEKTPASELFAGAGACMLSPEVTEGPLYVRGEEIRRDLTEGEGGVKMTIDIQVVDVKTCEPIPNAAVDFWSCNSTGVYGGVLNYPGNGNAADLSLINTTTLRGIQFTDAEGMAAFDTVVPGHYAGRTNHVHALVHTGVTQLPNKTITGGKVLHVGQMYFDQKLLDSVEKTAVYAVNKQQWTKNAVDQLMAAGANGDDPVVRYVQLSDKIEDGIYAWIRFGVDSTASRRYNPAAYIDEKGGHQLSGGGFPGGGFPGGFPGMPGAPGAPRPPGTPGMPGMPGRPAM